MTVFIILCRLKLQYSSAIEAAEHFLLCCDVPAGSGGCAGGIVRCGGCRRIVVARNRVCFVVVLCVGSGGSRITAGIAHLAGFAVVDHGWSPCGDVEYGFDTRRLGLRNGADEETSASSANNSALLESEERQ